jgi:hypothetical protein
MRIELYHNEFGIITDGERYEVTYRRKDEYGSACFEDGVMLYSDGEVPQHEVAKMLFLAEQLEKSNDKIDTAFKLREEL